MIKKVPDWFLDKYTTPVSGGLDIEPRQTQTMVKRPGLELDPLIGDTQQERERPISQLTSVRSQPDPIVVASLASKIGLDLQGSGEGILSEAPVRSFAPPKEGKKVFTDPVEWEKIMDEAVEETSPVTFKEAFKQARDQGQDEFEYKGGRFNTREKGETNEDWVGFLAERKEYTPFVEGFERVRKVEDLPVAPAAPRKQPSVLGAKEREASRRTQRIAAYQQSQAPKEQPIEQPTTPVFADYMQRSGVKVAKGKKIDVDQLSPKLGESLEGIGETLRSAGITPEITSGMRSQGNWSLHEIGEATDLRLKNASPEALEKLKNSLPGDPVSVKIHGKKGQLWKQGEYEYIIHGSGNNIHLHVERDNRETKAALAEHLVSKGKAKSIPRRGLRAYPDLLQKYFPSEQ